MSLANLSIIFTQAHERDYQIPHNSDVNGMLKKMNAGHEGKLARAEKVGRTPCSVHECARLFERRPIPGQQSRQELGMGHGLATGV